MSITIRQEQADSADGLKLIEELEAILSQHYPSESRHGYSVDKLIRQKVKFFIARNEQGEAAGCGGIQLFHTEEPTYGELKRMYVRPNFRGQGVAKSLLKQLEACAAENSINLVRLETGIHQTEAIHLYESWGFSEIGPFGDYFEDPNNRFYEKTVEHTA